ncbi:LLM class flavin-dependent oxidoreductase [Aquihabitans sp. G128]|uniref:LLM class flavin-dependent oxidoreductase n=1 Tax=Aquihabitans sp. G128 TaxID=2849779 RepID=UPI001C232EE3|nr:LLM class flavin-dependent oxidoreductase [Aquihabitans sp. G128]QXC61634.1 LLM class flavin-dependent oxidoreductase [Aquihabitans sp. G128]
MVVAPLGAGSVSLRLYPHDLAPAEVAAELAAQARLAEQSGFDGVMTSEHHGGFPNYLPNPLLAATWALAAMDEAWAAPSPMLLVLRPSSQVVEDLAWTAQRFPGRVGVGFATGAVEADFALAGVPFEERSERFRTALSEVAAALAGRAEGTLARDPAVAALAERPVPVASAAQGPVAARRAAGMGVGLLFDSIVSIDRAAEVSAAHAEAGGAGRTLIRRAWVGTPPGESIRTQMDRYRAAAPAAAQAHWATDGGMVAHEDPGEVAARLHAQVGAAGCTALNVRVFQAGVSPEAAREQIARLGAEVLPALRALGGWAAPPG